LGLALGPDEDREESRREPAAPSPLEVEVPERPALEKRLGPAALRAQGEQNVVVPVDEPNHVRGTLEPGRIRSRACRSPSAFPTAPRWRRFAPRPSSSTPAGRPARRAGWRAASW